MVSSDSRKPLEAILVCFDRSNSMRGSSGFEDDDLARQQTNKELPAWDETPPKNDTPEALKKLSVSN